MALPKGKLIAVGGNEDRGSYKRPGTKNPSNLEFFELGILKRILTESKGDNSRIEVITTASAIPKEIGKKYVRAFSKLGSENVGEIHLRSREDAENAEYADRLNEADALMFSGGNQLRISSIFGGTELLNIMQRRYVNDDFLIAGTSAGAMAMSTTMIYGGSSSEALLKGEVKITTGLSFINDVIIDTHFIKRGRFGRLAQAAAANPSAVGIGLGEDTGVLITNGNHMETIGSGLVLIIDGHHIKHTNISDQKPGMPISIENLKVHVLAKGYSYSLDGHKFIAEQNQV